MTIKNEMILKELNDAMMQVPVYVARDVNKRLHDWFEAGGLENSHYVRTQINFLKMIGAAKELCV